MLRIRYIDPAHAALGWVYHAPWCACWQCWDVVDGFFEDWIIG